MSTQVDHRICFVGDSFVQGTCDPECRGWVGRVAAAARAAGHDVTAYNLGVRRDTSRDVLARWQAECAARFHTECANYVVFAFGANDMVEEQGRLRVEVQESVANFGRVLDAARQRYRVLAVGPVPVGAPGHGSRVLDLCARYRQAAAQRDVPYLPVAARLLDDPLWRDDVAAQDGAHPGARGYGLLASLLLAWPAWWFGSGVAVAG